MKTHDNSPHKDIFHCPKVKISEDIYKMFIFNKPGPDDAWINGSNKLINRSQIVPNTARVSTKERKVTRLCYDSAKVQTAACFQL